MAKHLDAGLIEVKPKPVKAEVDSAKEAKPPPGAAAENASLNFKVSPEFRRRFRAFAGENDFQLNELLVQCFDLFVREFRGRGR